MPISRIINLKNTIKVLLSVKAKEKIISDLLKINEKIVIEHFKLMTKAFDLLDIHYPSNDEIIRYWVTSHIKLGNNFPEIKKAMRVEWL